MRKSQEVHIVRINEIASVHYKNEYLWTRNDYEKGKRRLRENDNDDIIRLRKVIELRRLCFLQALNSVCLKAAKIA